MHSTQGRCYGVGEIRAFLGRAGFEVVKYEHTTADRGAFVAIKK